MRYAVVLRAGDWSREKYPDLKDGEIVTTCGHRHKTIWSADSCQASIRDEELKKFGRVEECPAHEPERLVAA